MSLGYKSWEFHGERNSFANCDLYDEVEDGGKSGEDDDISDLLRDLACGLEDRGDFEDEDSREQANEDLEALEKLVNDSGQELYPGCRKYSKLRFIEEKWKVREEGGKGGGTDKSARGKRKQEEFTFDIHEFL
ncbi:hypothetical protein E2562_013201 [Oryza meyeriana var. granulata]|uniref:Uncharacterized protein n=1 Tax=Oryza meyeriana var. granulata TaxID=110450 RepID=A0A6G1DIK4_9ORYZ|nr:hypothetical protein E2562_013201 [Oryza meyeriana var. granulata]